MCGGVPCNYLLYLTVSKAGGGPAGLIQMFKSHAQTDGNVKWVLIDKYEWPYLAKSVPLKNDVPGTAEKVPRSFQMRGGLFQRQRGHTNFLGIAKRKSSSDCE